MSDLGIEALLERLKEMPTGASVQDLLFSLRAPESTSGAEARRRCALVRWFDRETYSFLCQDLPDSPEFEEFLSLPGVQQLAPAKWVVEAGERARLLSAWQADVNSWRAWNQKLGDFFAAHAENPEGQLSAVYHLAASFRPDAVEPLFRSWYLLADQLFDMAHCNALLEMLRLQGNWRGSAVSSMWREFREYQSARLLFADEYFKTGSYFERSEVLARFLSVLHRDTPAHPWIFHLHASGGIGKTMFTRWLIARYLVPARIPCARVDLDDFKLDELVNYPLRLIRRVIEQWSKQPKGAALATLLEKLVREEQVPGWNQNVVQLINSQLAGSAIGSGSVVVILDTLEEATLCAADWLKACVAFLRDIKSVIPGLTLVLSGRYDIAERSHALPKGESLNYELPRFTEAEAHEYLESRLIPAGPVRNAIVKRAAADEDTDGATQSTPGRNPFKLAMFAELALNRNKITEADVLRFPRADIAYLIERVVKRIESQPLRWIIRYGAIARHLTPEFAQAVLMPPLLRALRGSNTDKPARGLNDYDLEYKDVWKADPQAAAELEAKGISDLWERLSTYARDRGWLSWVDAGQRAELRFHPEVINPTRELLRQQTIFRELQEGAATFFESKARELEGSTPARDKESIRMSCEAIFHRFQLDGFAAAPRWLDALRRAEKIDPLLALPLATEIAGREYAEAERIPYSFVSSPSLLVRAHCEAADLLMRADIAGGNNWLDFRHHFELARSIAGDNPYMAALIPPLLRTMYVAGGRDTEQNSEAAGILRDAILCADDARDRFFLTLQLGKLLAAKGALEAGTYLRQALQLLPHAIRTSADPVAIHLRLIDLYDSHGIHTAVLEALKAALQSARSDRSRNLIVYRDAVYRLKVGDPATAQKRLDEIRKLNGTDIAADILEARIAVARLDPVAALAVISRHQQTALQPAERALCLEQEAEAHALLFQFEAALNSWNLASSSYDQARDPVGSARCALSAAALTAKAIGDFGVAETHVLSALNLRGSLDIEIWSELVLLHSLIHLRKGRLNEAAEEIRKLCSRTDLPVRLRTRVLIFSLLFGLDSGQMLLKQIEEGISEIQPLNVRNSILDWAEYSDMTLVVPPQFVSRLMEQLARPAVQSTRGSGQRILRADLYRVFGMRKEAETELDRVTDGTLLLGWRRCAARDRLDVHADYGALFERFIGSELSHTPLANAVLLAAAWEAASDHDFATASRLLNEEPIESASLPVSWQARLAHTTNQTAIKHPAEAVAPAASESKSPLEIFGAPAPAQGPPKGLETPLQGIVIAETDIPVEWRLAAKSVDLAVEMFFGGMPGGWQGFGEALASVLKSKNAEGQPIELSGSTGGLPWELAGAYCRQSEKVRLISLPTLAAGVPGAVQLVLPDSGASEISSSNDSGFEVDQVYRGYGIDPVMTIGSSRGPEGSKLGTSPVLLHIVAALREASSGVYLDFSTSEYRAASLGQDATVFEISLTAFRLDRFLASFPLPPFIILDVGLPYNRAEAVRMLLLRNLFATQLFELGHVRGILGCGMANPSDRYLLTSRFVSALVNGTLIDALDSLRSEVPGFSGRLNDFAERDLEYVLPRFCAALWSNQPHDRLFTV